MCMVFLEHHTYCLNICTITDLFRIPIYINYFVLKLLLIYHVAKIINNTKMCINTIQKQVIMNINNQDTCLQL